MLNKKPATKGGQNSETILTLLILYHDAHHNVKNNKGTPKMSKNALLKQKQIKPRQKFDYPLMRRTVWHMIIEILRAIHADRFPAGSRFGADAEKLLVYGAFVFLHLEDQDVRANKVAKYLNLPHETARRHIAKLISMDLLEREGPFIRPAPQLSMIPGTHQQMVLRLLSDVAQHLPKIASGWLHE